MTLDAAASHPHLAQKPPNIHFRAPTLADDVRSARQLRSNHGDISMLTKRDFLRSVSLAAITVATAKSCPLQAETTADRPGFSKAKDIAEAGFIYGLPIVMNYARHERVRHRSQSRDSSRRRSIRSRTNLNVFTYKDTAIVTTEQRHALFVRMDGPSRGAMARRSTAANNGTSTFPPGQLPPVNAFWSLTMYDGKTQLLIENPINRYLINSPMLPAMKTSADGSLTLYIQNKSPGADKEANWLPAPDGPIYLVMRLYWPRQTRLRSCRRAKEHGSRPQ